MSIRPVSIDQEFSWQLALPTFQNPCSSGPLDMLPIAARQLIYEQFDSETMGKFCCVNTKFCIQFTEYVNAKIAEIPLSIRDTGEGSMPFINRCKIIETVDASHSVFDKKTGWTVLVMREGTNFDRLFNENEEGRRKSIRFWTEQMVTIDPQFFTHSEKRTTVSLISNGLFSKSFNKTLEEQSQFLEGIRCEMIPLAHCLAFCMHRPEAFDIGFSCRTTQEVPLGERASIHSFCFERSPTSPPAKKKSNIEGYNKNRPFEKVGAVIYREL